MTGFVVPCISRSPKEFTGREPINVSASLPHARPCRFIANLWPWALHHAPPPPRPGVPLLLKPTRSRSRPHHSPPVPMAAVTTATAAASSSFLRRRSPAHCPRATLRAAAWHCRLSSSSSRLACRAAEVSGAEPSSAAPTAAEGAGGGGGASWVPVVPLAALPRGERRVIVQDGEEILLLWYKDQVFAIENRSPAEGAYTEGLLNAKLTQVRLDSSSRQCRPAPLTTSFFVLVSDTGVTCSACPFWIPYETVRKQKMIDNQTRRSTLISNNLQIPY